MPSGRGFPTAPPSPQAVAKQFLRRPFPRLDEEGSEKGDRLAD